MILYHGSPFIIEKPKLSKGKVSNDYGQGFYCTENIEMAREWACKGKEPPAFVNIYEVDLSGLKVLNLSEQAFGALRFVRADEVPWDEYHGRYIGRDAAARREWREKLKGGASAGHFANDVIRMGLKHGDERIRELLPA